MLVMIYFLFFDPQYLQGNSTFMRVVNGFRYLRQAVKLAPEMWTTMLIRVALKPEFHRFTLDIISAFSIHFSHKLPETFWVFISRLLHKMARNNRFNDL